ncbi:hypothetical protein MSIMFB_03859 [Mycobacterium simulans]|uniref:Mce protein n=1 Tax=Mycobacterium simulans TaxID=627089 RepID=A0A7Z7NB00_9MYCO|nr:hypothetical protein [Mycobacterium simulans]SOJ56382.1 hypothetical protein MSIMFB_03859 [Mycobacterium simulans]
MAETSEPPTDSVNSKADAMALVEEAEAEAAEAEALAAAARARARAARLRRQLAGDADADYEDFDEDDEEYDEEDVEDYEDAEHEGTNPASWRSRLPSWVRIPALSTIATAAAILIICGFTAFSGYIVWTHHEATERQQRAAAFAAGARQGVVNMTSLDFNKAKEDVQRVIDSSTGEFRDDFQARAADFTKVVEQSKVVTEGTVNATAVESMGEHSALVLVSATSRVTNSAGAKDEPRAWRLRVTVTEEAGQYKMSKVEFVP